jgi:hypothetical protein
MHDPEPHHSSERAPTIDELHIADDPERWAALGFAVADDCCELGSVRVRLTGGAVGGGMVGWSLRDVRSLELDGLPTTRSAAPLREPAPAHPNGVIAIDHVVAISPALERSMRALQSAGLQLRRIREQPTPTGAPRQAFFRLGAEILEVVQEPDDAVLRGGGPERPARLWGLAFTASDLERTASLLAPHVKGPRPAVQPGRQIATVRRSAGLAVPVALMTPAPVPTG